MVDATSLGMLTAFAAGAVSFLSPCVLPMVPGYMSYVTGQSLQRASHGAARTRATLLGLFFVLGFSAAFMALGASASFVGRLLLSHKREAEVAGGILVAAFGLVMIVGVERIPGLRRDIHADVPVSSRGPFSAFLLGLAFALGWTPCIGPVLGAILTATAVSESSSSGLRLLGAYSAGLGVPFLLTAMFLHEASRRLRAVRRLGRPLMFVAGAVMIVMGIAMMTGKLTQFSYWLLERFPALGRIG